MFVYDPEPKFTHPVTAHVPADGGHEAQTFNATFRVMGDTQLGTFDMNDRASTVAFLREVLVGFGDVEDAAKQPVVFSDRTRDWLIDLPYTRAALVKGYFGGVYKAALGN